MLKVPQRCRATRPAGHLLAETCAIIFSEVGPSAGHRIQSLQLIHQPDVVLTEADLNLQLEPQGIAWLALPYMPT